MSQHQVHRVHSIAEFHKMKGLPSPQHPLISLFDYASFECSKEINHKNFVFDFYHISIKRSIGAKYKYGQNNYEFDDGVMFFIAPNQVFGIEKIEEIATTRSGWILMVHPDFLWNTPLAATIKQYEFLIMQCMKRCFFLKRKKRRFMLLSGISNRNTTAIWISSARALSFPSWRRCSIIQTGFTRDNS